MPRRNTIVVMSLFFVALTHVALGGKIIDIVAITYQNKNSPDTRYVNYTFFRRFGR